MLGSIAILMLLQAKQTGSTGLVYGEKCAFFLTAPSGWVLDAESGRNDGPAVVFYPKGSSWRESLVVMYARSRAKKEGETLKQYLDIDRNEFLEHDKNMVIRTMPAIKTKDRAKVTVVGYESKEKSNYDLVAFVDLPEAIATLCLSARTLAEREKAYSAFEKLVGSFTYVGSKVKIKR